MCGFFRFKGLIQWPAYSPSSKANHMADTKLPESNLSSVLTAFYANLVADDDGTGLIHATETLLERAKQLRDKKDQGKRASEHIRRNFDATPLADFESEDIDNHYEPVCMKWFIAGLCKEIADLLQYQAECFQRHGTPISTVDFNSDGTINSFTLRQQ